ncbi:MAG: hypothetical protein L0Y56_04925 [Nitrospira sp.]|nr:hypothetical protein [Nitrospira sp.]
MTKRSTSSDAAGSASNQNPIILNARGESPNAIYLDDGVIYRFGLAAANVLGDPPSSLIRDIDNIEGVNDLASVQANEWIASNLTPTFISATSFSLLGDQTSNFHVRRRLRTLNSSGTIYSAILTSVFTSVTTVTVVNDSGSLDSGLSKVDFGIISHVNTSAPRKFIDSQAFTSSGTWTRPVGTRAVRVRVLGGGGAGGGAVATTSTQNSIGGGGGAGGYTEEFITTGIGATETVTVGSGGTAVSGGTGNAGGNSSFGGHLTANGGVGGAASAAITVTVSAFGTAAGGSGGVSSGGQINGGGASGGHGIVYSDGVQSFIAYGDGASSAFGGGGKLAPNVIASGDLGIGFGSGGSGAQNGGSQSARLGGAGTPGLVLVDSYA